MFSKSAQYYDEIYSFKNYAEEAEKILQLIRSEHPTARTVLDVACGTAEHARLLSAAYVVDGIDLEPSFIEAAKAKVPSGTFSIADMRDFDLPRRYDVVQCLFSSIGYLTRKDDVIAALRTFSKHLAPGGIILVEAWFTPDEWHDGVPWMVTVDKPELKICRMNLSERDGNISKIRFHYLIGTPSGVEYVEEDHALALYTVDEMQQCFGAAGLTARHDPVGIFGRGLYVARRRS